MEIRFAVLLAVASLLPAAESLQVYAIDVEGGKSTLFVSPSGKTMLIDTGYDGFGGRDAKRILRVARIAGVKEIDYLVITHYHQDHMGGVGQLVAELPIHNFIDHGENFEKVKDIGRLYNAYVALRERRHHIVVGAGDVIPISGIRVQVVTASGRALSKALPGAGTAANPSCATYQPIAPDPGENAHSIGLLVTYGDFRLADLGDLYWNQEYDLACPTNKLGTVDVCLTTHHGAKTSGSPQMVRALHPIVAIMNNGPRKGGSREAWQTIHDSPGLQDLWQLHYSLVGGPDHNGAEAFIANPLEDCQGDWIQLSASQDGTFTVRNSRNGYEKTYHH
jgi:beta-lactamase superfamily II metal-dependent hydrolase